MRLSWLELKSDSIYILLRKVLDITTDVGVTIQSYVAWVQILCQLLSYDPLRGNGYELCDGPFVVYEVVAENLAAVRNQYDLPPRSVGVALVLGVLL